MPTNLLPLLAAFLEVVDAGSFTAAARRTGTDKTVMSRRVKALEEALGVRLMNRTTRALHVTAAGQRLVDHAREPLADAMAALHQTQAPDRVDGVVRIASAQSLAQQLLVPVIAGLRATHPGLRVELSASERFGPLVDGGFELALRVGRQPDSGLISRKLASWRHVLVASPDWVASHPDVSDPADLPPHWILWGHTPRAQAWSFERGDARLDVRFERSALMFDASQLLVESARAGLGVAAMPPFSVTRELQEGSLVRVLPEWSVAHDLGVFGVTPHRTLLPARVQVVLQSVRARLAELTPIWQELTQ
ncbi:MAG: LysR family transcriptional regulator [Proteobacteria bacterium]|nr:LysR family transcriptional regulator [Pseudomonadota bacterium]MCP4916290.1 LysR family transcriptional regulator [Pseudomonadota bacterium]